MADEQAGSNPPENESYDGGMLADVRAAFNEVTAEKAEPEKAAEPEKIAEPEPKAEAVVEPKADHPTDEKRYADGTFKPTKTAEEAPAKVVEPLKAEAPQPTSEVQAAATISGNPPGGWSVKSKAEWDKIPEHIRADILKREKEVNDGFAQYEGMRELRPYHEQARSQGQSLKQILDGFLGLEAQLRQNPEQGFLTIASRLGIQPQRLAQAFAGYAPSTGQYQPQQDGGYQPQPSSDYGYVDQRLNPLANEVNQLKSLFQQQREAEVNAVIQRFAADPAHRFYQNVEEQMTQILATRPRSGDHWADLKKAYDDAVWLNPEIRESLLNERSAKAEEARKQQEKEAAEKARQASRSITGSPAAGAKTDPDDSDDSIEADVRRAVRAHAA